jgi:hypothetical protein
VISQRLLSESLGIPGRLLTVNPEEDAFDWDDPFMDFFYEIRIPRQPTAEDYVLPKVSMIFLPTGSAPNSQDMMYTCSVQ